MLGSFLLGGPRNCRNRDLFRFLYPKEATDTGLYYSVAKNAKGERTRINGVMTRDGVTADLLDPFPGEVSRKANEGRVSDDVHDLYKPVCDNPDPNETLAPDVLVTGVLGTLSIPSRGLSLCFGSSAGRTERVREGALEMIRDDREIPLSEKVATHVSPSVEPGECAQVCLVWANVCILLVRNVAPLYAYLMYKRGNMYFVWSSTHIAPSEGDEFVWPVGAFQDGSIKSAVGLDLRTIRTRWLKHNQSFKDSGNSLAKSVALFHRWLCNHIAGTSS